MSGARQAHTHGSRLPSAVEQGGLALGWGGASVVRRGGLGWRALSTRAWAGCAPVLAAWHDWALRPGGPVASSLCSRRAERQTTPPEFCGPITRCPAPPAEHSLQRTLASALC